MRICPLCQQPIVKGQRTFRDFEGRGVWKHQDCVPGPMKTILPKIPCGDQLREAWLEAANLYADVTDLMRALDAASDMANNGNPQTGQTVKDTKEITHRLSVRTFKVRDMITVWQAWASNNSSID